MRSPCSLELKCTWNALNHVILIAILAPRVWILLCWVLWVLCILWVGTSRPAVLCWVLSFFFKVRHLQRIRSTFSSNLEKNSYFALFLSDNMSAFFRAWLLIEVSWSLLLFWDSSRGNQIRLSCASGRLARHCQSKFTGQHFCSQVACCLCWSFARPWVVALLQINWRNSWTGHAGAEDVATRCDSCAALSTQLVIWLFLS